MLPAAPNRRSWATPIVLMVVCGFALYVFIGEQQTKPGVATQEAAPVEKMSPQPLTPELPHELTPLTKSQSVSAPKFQDVDWRPWIKAMIAHLIERGDAESLVAAALLVVQPSYSKEHEASVQEALDLLNRAAVLDSSNAVIRFAALMVCGELEGCDQTPYEQALRSVDPRNAYGWLGEFTRSAGNSGEQLKALSAMAEHERFDIYPMQIYALMERNISSVRLPPPVDLTAERLTGHSPLDFLIGTTSSLALPLPKTKPIIDFCRDTQQARESCLKVMQQFRNGDSYFVQAVGVSAPRRWTPVDSDLGRELAAARRRLEWLSYQINQINLSVALLSRLHAGTKGEVEVWEAALQENSIPITPPDDWVRSRPN